MTRWSPALLTKLRRRQILSRISLFLLLLNAALLLLIALAIAGSAPSQIDMAFEGAKINIRADRAWVLLPRQCVNVSWKMEGIQSLSVDGRAKPGSGALEFCPTLNATSLQFDISAANGEPLALGLHIHDLPAAVVSSAALLFLLLPFFLALYYLATLRIAERIPLNASPVLTLLALLLVCLLIQTALPFSIEGFISSLANLFISPLWQGFGTALAGIVFIPLAAQSLRRGMRGGFGADFVVMGALFAFLLLLYAPFGFESIGQQDSWYNLAYFEGRPSKVARETVSRFWLLASDYFAHTISAASFFGFHIQYLLMLWGISVLFYAILRRFQLAPLYAFIVTMLVMVYPVNSHLMSLRSTPHAFSKLALFASVYFALECRGNVSRLRLLGLWLALSFNVASYQSALVIIFLVPVLWWWRSPRWTWRNFNLTAIWYLIPAAQIIYIILLSNAGRKFYGAIYLSQALRQERTIFENINHHLGVVGKVYLQTFLHGWQEAFNSLGQNIWIAPTLAAVFLTGTVSVYLARRSQARMFPSRNQLRLWLVAGNVFILPSIAVLMWFEKYQVELWRMYIYVPFGAAVVLTSLLLMLVLPIKNARLRHALAIGLFLMLMLPATSRLFVQHAHFVESANAKARILTQLVEQVPRFNSNARLVLATNMSLDELAAVGISELWTNMFDGAIYLLYGEDRPMYSSLCILGGACSTDDIDKSIQYLDDDLDYRDIVIFRLNDDLSVELLPELPPELGGQHNHSYNPSRLIDRSAPIPPRALTMLASARRE